MDHLAVALLIPVAVIVMGGLTQVARELSRGRRQPDLRALDAHIDAMEQELRSVRQELSETQERLDFAERLLTQAQERKELGAKE
jgi:hypothetical protein